MWPNTALEPTPVSAFSSAFAVDITGPAWLSLIVRRHDTFMKYLPNVATIIVQSLAMIFFMRVVHWDIFLSAGLSAVLAMTFGFAVYFIQKRNAARKSGL